MQRLVPSARTLARLAILPCFLFTGCIRPTAVDDLARLLTQASQLAPSVMATGYNACAAEATRAQLAKIKHFDPAFQVNAAQIEQDCQSEKKTRERLTRTFQVMVGYVQMLDKLASGGATTYDKSIKALASDVPGLTSAQAKAVTGLASLVADVVEKHWRERQVARAIEQAQPHMLVLTKMFDDDIPRFLLAMLDNGRDSWASLYEDIAARPPCTNPILVTLLYSERKAALDKSRDGIQAFQKLMADLQTGHTALYNHRNRLTAVDTMQELSQVSSDMQTQVAAMRVAFQ